jgi:excisionase family DNA binding protein
MFTEYLTLESLAATLHLPQKYLRELTEQGEIPCLFVSRRMRFDEGDVRKALSVLSHKGMKP